MEMDYDILQDEVLNLLDENPVMVLATSSNDRVTARSISCVHIGLTILFQTDRTSVKYEQIELNQNVALCVDKMQIEGLAEIRGPSSEDQNRRFLELYKKHHPGPFKKYTHLKDEVVIAVHPKVITLWKYQDSGPYRDFLYVAERKATREYVNIMKS